VPKFCQRQVPQWEAIIHHHLKRDKVIPSSHPQATEIKHNPNGYEALMLLMCPHHPVFTDNRILIQSHPQQGRRTLDEHCWKMCASTTMVSLKFPLQDPLQQVASINTTIISNKLICFNNK